MRFLVGRLFAYYFDIATSKAPSDEGTLARHKTAHKAPHRTCIEVRPYQFAKLEFTYSLSINTALHGEPSAPAKFSGAAFKK